MADTLKATPRNEFLHGAGSILGSVKEALNRKRVLSPVERELAGKYADSEKQLSIGDLLLGRAPEALQDWSYQGSSPFSGTKNIQTFTVDPRAVDVAGVVAPFAGKAIEMTKGLPVGMSIKPVGNLNFQSRLDELIKGPETQSVFDLLKQVQGKPGVTKEGLKKIAKNYPDSAAKVSKEEFKKNIPASYYRKEDLKADSQDLFDNYVDEAMEHMDYGDTFYGLGLPEPLHEPFDNIISGHTEFSELDPQQQRIFKRLFGLDDNVADNEAFGVMGDRYMEQRNHDAYNYAEERLNGETDGGAGYSYKDFQRLVGPDEPGYFEFGVTHPEQAMKEARGEAKRYRHYSNKDMPDGLIGHVRGSHVESPTTIEGNIEVPANSYIIEEIQSDAQKGVEQTGALHQAHGTMFKAAVQDALEKGADRIYLPTSYPISRVRGKHPEDYASIYDKAIVKEGLEPLSKIPGVEIKPIFKELENEHFFQNHPDYHEIKLSPEAREHILLGPGQSTPGYAAGGLVSADDYDDEHVDKLSDALMQGEYGLRETGEPKTRGALGEIRMPNGRDVMTEYLINPGGRGEIPSIVEGMHPADVNYLRYYAENPTEDFPAGVEAVAIRSAKRRQAEGKPAFYAEGGEVKDPFADLSVLDKAALLAKAAKYRIQYNKQAEEHGKYPDILSSALKDKYREQVGNSRVNRSPLDAAINYGGGYDFGVRNDIPANVARDMAKAYQYTDYFFSPFTGPKSDAVGDYYENMAGVEAGIKERNRRASEADIIRRSADYGRRTSKMLPQNVEENYAKGGLVYNDEEINNLANQLFGA